MAPPRAGYRCIEEERDTMGTETPYDLVIVGGGPGGLTAAIYAMRAAMRTVLVERGAPGGQVMMSDSVENWPGDQHLGGAELSQKFLDHALSYGLEVINEEVVEIEPGLDYHRVRLGNGVTLDSHAVILGSGGSPRKLGVPGEIENHGRGVSYCAVCDGFFFRNKTVLVVGGGDSATEESLYLAKLAGKVYIAHRRDKLRASMLLQKRVLADCKIEVLWNTVVRRIESDAGGVSAVTLAGTKGEADRHLPVDGVFVFIGFDPNNRLVPAGVRMNGMGYVTTDEKFETAIPGLFVIGDLREKYARQIVLAAADGCTAALAAAHFVEGKKAGEVCELPAGP
jgi:thioredoxin reductase (NADPH)